jgi:hypothetical protein
VDSCPLSFHLGKAVLNLNQRSFVSMPTGAFFVHEVIYFSAENSAVLLVKEFHVVMSEQCRPKKRLFIRVSCQSEPTAYNVVFSPTPDQVPSRVPVSVHNVCKTVEVDSTEVYIKPIDDSDTHGVVIRRDKRGRVVKRVDHVEGANNEVMVVCLGRAASETEVRPRADIAGCQLAA